MSFIKKVIENPHYIYKNYCSYWNFLLQSFEGGIDYTNAQITSNNGLNSITDSLFTLTINGVPQNTSRNLTGNLFKHAKERDDDYYRRVDMSYYYNFCDPIIDIYSNHLFKKNVDEDFKNIEDSVKEVENNIDNKGSSVSEFRREVADLAQVYGHIYVVCDSPMFSDTDILTRKDQIDNRAFPYFCIYTPQNLINWALDEFGRPYWVLLRECSDANINVEEYNADTPNKVLFRLWTRNEWKLYNDKYELVAEGKNPLGYVPIRCFYNKKSKKVKNFLGISSIADIAFIARDIYNSSSEMRQILRDQTFAFLAIQGTSDEYRDIEIGTAKGLLYPEGRNVPQYVSPPSDNVNVYFTHIDRQIAKIYQIAKLDGGGLSGNSQTVVDSQSGTSKAWDFNQTNSSLSTKSLNLEDGEMALWMMFANWEGKDFDGSVSYPDEFDVSSMKQDLDELEQVQRLEFGELFNSQLRENIIRKKYPRMPEDEISKIVQESETALKRKNVANSIIERAGRVFPNNATSGQN